MEHFKLIEDLDDAILYITNKITTSEEVGISTPGACLKLQMALNRLETIAIIINEKGKYLDVKSRLRELLLLSKDLSVAWNSCKIV